VIVVIDEECKQQQRVDCWDGCGTSSRTMFASLMWAREQ
jgi:hypothetical protein